MSNIFDDTSPCVLNIYNFLNIFYKLVLLVKRRVFFSKIRVKRIACFLTDRLLEFRNICSQKNFLFKTFVENVRCVLIDVFEIKR